MSEPFSWSPIGQLIGLEVQPGGVGEAEVFLDVDQRMHNPMGFVHGGVIALLADATMGIAFGRALDNQHGFATIETTNNGLTFGSRLLNAPFRLISWSSNNVIAVGISEPCVGSEAYVSTFLAFDHCISLLLSSM